MIFAAGLGTRLKPLTDTKPKALVEVGGKPLLWHVIHRLRQAGFGRIVINVHHFASQIVDYVHAHDDFGLDIRISNEQETLLDTGGGIRHAASLFDADSPVLIHNVDILSSVDLKQLYEAAGDADAALLVPPRGWSTRRVSHIQACKRKRRISADIRLFETRSSRPHRQLQQPMMRFSSRSRSGSQSITSTP